MESIMGKVQGVGECDAARRFNDSDGLREVRPVKSRGGAMGDLVRGQRFGTLQVTRAELIDAGRRLVLELHGGELNRHEVGMFMRELQSLQEKMQPVTAATPALLASRPLPEAEEFGSQSQPSGC
jgi:hypothetical protein